MRFGRDFPPHPLDNGAIFAIIIGNYLVSRRLTVLMDTTEGDTDPARAVNHHIRF